MKLLKQIAPLFLIMNIFPAIVRIFVLDKFYIMVVCVWCTVRVYNTKNGNSIINETISTYIAHLNPKIP